MAYQLTLLDIVIFQTVVRRKFARLEFYGRCEIQDNGAASILQTKWRGAVARMTYQLALWRTLSLPTVWYDASLLGSI
jgi:hypothetical protein